MVKTFRIIAREDIHFEVKKKRLQGKSRISIKIV